MPNYTKHLFFCINQKKSGKKCCAMGRSVELCQYAKKKIKALDLPLEQVVRVNQSGCLDECEKGPTLVIYPEGIWYHYEREADIDEIIETHILGGQVVERLLMR